MGELLAPPELHGLWVGILQQDQKPLSEAEWVDDIENSNNTFPLYKKLAFSPRPDFPLCFYFQVSQPGHCWHLRPDNSVVGSVLCNVKSLATSLASACWVPVVSPFPHPHPPSCDNQRCPLGAKITPGCESLFTGYSLKVVSQGWLLHRSPGKRHEREREQCLELWLIPFEQRIQSLHFLVPSPSKPAEALQSLRGPPKPGHRSKIRQCSPVFKCPGVMKFQVWIPLLAHSWSVTLGELLNISESGVFSAL